MTRVKPLLRVDAPSSVRHSLTALDRLDRWLDHEELEPGQTLAGASRLDGGGAPGAAQPRSPLSVAV